MKLLLDQGLPVTSATILRDAGWDVVHTAEVSLSTAKDREILAIAKQQGRSIVTLDADFHALLVLLGATMPSVVRVRIEGLRSGDMAKLLLQVLPTIKDKLLAGAMVTITARSVRVKNLWR
jgi:predicted nuclease of predicted toxin-antitoxin system